MLTNTIGVLVGLRAASAEKMHYGCFKIALRAVRCVWEFPVSDRVTVVPITVVFSVPQ